MAIVSTVAFSMLCLLAAWLVYLHRPNSRAGLSDPGFWIAIILPSCAALLFGIGSYAGHGRQLSLSVQELRIPFLDIEKDGVYFVAGPLREKSDLVVGPYADAQQSQENYRQAFDDLLIIRRKQSAWQICGKWVNADIDRNLPGMGIALGSGRLNGCQPLTETAVEVSIERVDVDGDSQTRRSLSIVQHRDHISIALPTAEQLTRHVGKCDGARAKDVLRLAPAGLHDPDRGYRIPDNLVFDQLGQGGDNPVLKPSLLGPMTSLQSLCAKGPGQVSWPTNPNEARLIMSSRTTSLAWWILGLLFLSSLWTWRTSHDYWRDGAGRIEASIVLTLQWLLALRLIIAMAGLFNNDGLRQASVLWAPAMAFVVVPMLVAGLLRGGERDATRSIPALLLQLPFALLLIFWGQDWQMPGGQEVLLAALSAGLLIWRRWSKRPEPVLMEVVNIARIIGVSIYRMLQKRSAFFASPFDNWTAGILLVSILVIVRGLLLAMGFKERFTGLPLLENLPVSMLYIPPLIVGMALMISGYRAVPTLLRAVLLVGAFGASFILVGFFASDFGMIWIYAWPAGWAIATLLAVKPISGKIGGGLIRLVLIGPLLSPLLLAALYFGWNIRAIPAPQTDLAGHVEAVAAWDRTAARLQRHIDPDKLIDAGSSASFEMLEQAAQLEPLTADVTGHGYLAPSGIVMPLLKYQYSDNLLAVHILWPFGRMGLAIFLLSLLMIVQVFWRTRKDGKAGERWQGEAGRLAAMTFFWSAAYMALANLNLVPFTGRNAYLLASQSMGDLAEGLLLLLLIVLPLVAAQSAKGTAAVGMPR